MDLFLSIRCPQCGAQISFEEESTVIHCEFCGSALCLSGRSGVMRTYVEPRMNVVRMKKALKGAMKGLEGDERSKALISAKKLFFAPYWRVKGMVFRWVFGKNFQGKPIKALKTKNLDQTFPAFGDMNLGLRSLGIRPEALTLRFYDKKEMASQGAVMKIVMPFDEAVRHSQNLSRVGLDELNIRISLDRTRLVGERYSMIYFPFWMIRLRAGEKSRVLIVDAVANTVTRSLSLEEWSQLMEKAGRVPAPVSFNRVSFIPFKCPNCGWELPLNRFHIIHVCNSCHQAWMERSGRFQGVAFDVVEPRGDAPAALVYLPFWTFPAQITGHGETLKTAGDLFDFSGRFPTRVPRETDRTRLRLYLPAAEIRNISAANKLATDITQNQPSLRFIPKENLTDCTFLGTCLRPESARHMADILLYSLTPKGNQNRQKFVREATVTAEKMKLIWWPFFEQRLFLRDTVCGCGIQKGTVLPSPDLPRRGMMDP